MQARILATVSDAAVISDVVIVVAIVIAIVIGALFVGGRIAPRTDKAEPEVDNDEP